MKNLRYRTPGNPREILRCKMVAGFTMAEVVVAVALLSTSLLAVFGVLRACSAATTHTKMLTKSVLLAESLLTQAKLTEPMVFGKTQGREGSFTWQIQIASAGVEHLAAVGVAVMWQEQRRLQQYELYCLIHTKPRIEG